MNQPNVIQLELPATYTYLNVLGTCLSEVIARVDDLTDSSTIAYNIQLAVHEACTNIIDHAYGGPCGERIGIAMTVQPSPRQLIVELHDTGRSFDPDQVPQPTLDDVQVHGYGLFLMRELMDEVTYAPQPGNNRWRLVKYL